MGEGVGGGVPHLRQLFDEFLKKDLDVLRHITQDKSLQGLAESVAISHRFILYCSPRIIPFKEDVECFDEDGLVLLATLETLPCS